MKKGLPGCPVSALAGLAIPPLRLALGTAPVSPVFLTSLLPAAATGEFPSSSVVLVLVEFRISSSRAARNVAMIQIWPLRARRSSRFANSIRSSSVISGLNNSSS